MNTNGGDCLGYFLPATDDQADCGAVEQSCTRHKSNDDCKSGWRWRIISDQQHNTTQTREDQRRPYSPFPADTQNRSVFPALSSFPRQTKTVLEKEKKSKIIICCLFLKPPIRGWAICNSCVCHQTRDWPDQPEAENLSFCHSRPTVRPMRRRLSISCHQRGHTLSTNECRLEDRVTLWHSWHYNTLWH